ncbi:MAG: Sua5/YciO/YrdC/YwlC family protein [Bacteroidales bacterium]|nr:Sua5/YciO/YrdC/YwlC family protein [Bacteroidales bacterium]
MDDIFKCVEALKAGGIILYPTDTVWCLGCDATNDEAVRKIITLKQSSDLVDMIVLVDHADRIGRYIKQIPEVAIQLLEVNDKPMTIIYPGALNLAPSLIAPDGSVAISISGDDFCKKLIAAFNKPIVSSSANLTGEPFPKIFREISEHIRTGADCIVKWRQNDPAPGAESSLIKVGLKGEVEIIRK